MRYLGGKSKIAKKIALVIEQYLKPGQTYVEPFLGGCNVLPLISDRPKIASDVLEDIILMYKALAAGWEPPQEVSENLYNFLKNDKPSSIRGFVGIACSFSGKFFGGYARSSEGRNYAKNGYNTALKTAPRLVNVELHCLSYDCLVIPPNSLIYCDPPYANTTKYTTIFDHEKFYNWCKKMTREGHIVLISEYSMPHGFTEVCSIERNLEMRTNKLKSEKRVDKLFICD